MSLRVRLLSAMALIKCSGTSLKLARNCFVSFGKASVHEQQDRVLQQADKANGEEADPIRDRGGVGKADRLDVPALQRRSEQEKSEMLEGNRCLLRIKVIRIRMQHRESFTQDSGYSPIY